MPAARSGRRRRGALGAIVSGLGALGLSVLATVAGGGSAAAVGSNVAHVVVAPVSIAAPAVDVTPGQDVPDPFVITADGLFFMFSSQQQIFGPNIPLMVSDSLTSWDGALIDAMPTLPVWAAPGFTWSPDVRRLDGRYVMWFNARLAGTGPQGMKCIGVATALSIVGPYRTRATAPSICQRDHLGSIDPRTFLDPQGRLWLLWKSDDNADVAGSAHSTIYTQRLSADGLRLLGHPVALLTADLPWEGRIVEAPDMVFAAGHYWLFFSGNWFNQPAYAIGVASCAGPVGPCSETSLGPWLSSNADGAGPGEESIFEEGSRWWILYAPFAVNFDTDTPRPAVLARLRFGPSGPVVVAPGTAAWSAPGPGAVRAPAAVFHPRCTSRAFEATCDAWKQRLAG